MTCETTPCETLEQITKRWKKEERWERAPQWLKRMNHAVFLRDNSIEIVEHSSECFTLLVEGKEVETFHYSLERLGVQCNQAKLMLALERAGKKPLLAKCWLVILRTSTIY